MKKLYFLLFTFLIAFASFGQTTGDVAFIAFNADGQDDFAIVALADIPANTTIHFTDNEPDGVGGLTTGEGAVSWDSGGSIIAAGTVVIFTDISSSTVLVASIGTLTDGTGSMNLAAGGDALFAFTGADDTTPTTFLAGVQNETGNEGTLTGTGLTDGSTFFTFTTSGNPDGGVYSGLRNNQAAFADYLTQIALPANWDEEVSNGELLLPFDATAFTLGTPTPTITVTAPVDGTVFAPGTTSVNVEFITTNLVGGETVDIDVNGTVTTGITSPFAVTTADGQAYNITLNLMDGAVIVDFEGVDFSVGALTIVADITALRADVDANGSGGFYEITGAALLTHTDSFNNRKWIQDATSGVLIYDNAGVIATTYAIGDQITGLKGTTAISNGVIQFIPTEDSGVIASSGNPVVPQTVTIPAFNAAPDDYESELIELQNVTFVEGDGIATFATGQNYGLTDGSNFTVKRTDFFSADYIGTIIPSSQLSSVVGVAGEFNGTSQIYARSLMDFTLSANQFDVNSFSIYPNPTNSGFVNITSANNDLLKANVFDILGKQVLESNVVNNQLNVSGLNAGIYILKLTQNNASVTKKLVIR